MSPGELLAAARAARDRARAPYSGYRVGAAVLDAQGRVFTGANVENASYGLTMCAERVALFRAVSEGAGKIVALAVAAAGPGAGARPCGACRQVMAELAPEATVHMGDVSAAVTDLLPLAFGPGALPAAGEE